MSFFISLLLVGTAVAAPGSVCSKAPYNALLPLSKNAFARSFCSSKYPLPTVTSTTSTSYVTTTVAASTTTTISTTVTPTVLVSTTNSVTITTTLESDTTQTITATATTTTTSTSTVATNLSTTTIVTDSSGKFYKREEPTPVVEQLAVRAVTTSLARIKDFKTSIAASFSSCTKSMPVSVLSTACSCIETPLTANVVATSTVRTTSTSTLSTTTTLTSPTTSTVSQTVTNTATAFSTSTIVTTSTTTTTSTTVTAVTATGTAYVNVCGTSFNAPSGDPVSIQCGSQGGAGDQHQSFTANTFYACFLSCDNDLSCADFSFQFSTLQCITYGPADDTRKTYQANPDFVYGYYYP